MHFWLGTVGILLYVAAMWTSGITQGLMLNATTEGGTVLAYPNFIDTLTTIRPMMLMRVVWRRPVSWSAGCHARWNIWSTRRRRSAGQRHDRGLRRKRRPPTRRWASVARSSMRQSSSPRFGVVFASELDVRSATH